MYFQLDNPVLTCVIPLLSAVGESLVEKVSGFVCVPTN